MEDDILLRIRTELFERQDLPFRDFTIRGIPGAKDVIGVRIPEVRQIAKGLCRGDFGEYLNAEPKEYFEEILLHGVVVAQAKMELDSRLEYTEKFIPRIDNWAVCDVVANSFRIKPDQEATYWDFLTRYLNSNDEFAVRFMLVMMLDHFLKDNYTAEVLAVADAVKHSGYYVEMAKAWLVAEALVKDREVAMSFIYDNHLSDFAFNKAIQKARESYRVSAADKELLLKLKRKKSGV